MTPPGDATTIPTGSRVHLVPAEREQTDNLLRYSETLVNSDGTFAFTNLALAVTSFSRGLARQPNRICRNRLQRETRRRAQNCAVRRGGG